MNLLKIILCAGCSLCLHTCTHAWKSEPHELLSSTVPTLFIIIADLAKMAGQWAPGILWSLSSSKEEPGNWLFTWVPGIQAQALMLELQALHIEVTELLRCSCLSHQTWEVSVITFILSALSTPYHIPTSTGQLILSSPPFVFCLPFFLNSAV